MSNPQRTLEDCMAAMFDDLTVHPAGVVIGRAKGHQVRVVPTREDFGLTGWSYVFTDPNGNETVSANTVSHLAVLVGRIQRWRWSL